MNRPSSNGSLLRVGDLARMTGKTVRAIHLYEELGLLKPSTRSSGGFRLYEAKAVDRVRWIDLLHGMGFSLHEMREVLNAWWRAEVAPDAMGRLRGLFQAKLRHTREALERHAQLERELIDGLAYLEACKVCPTQEAVDGCAHCSHDHGMTGEPALLKGFMSEPAGNPPGKASRPSGGARSRLVSLEDFGSKSGSEPVAEGRGRRIEERSSSE